MNAVFSSTGLSILESLAFTRTLYAFDFDGTLSRIVRIPDSAALSRRTARLLARLAELAPVAIVSGRGVTDLRSRVRLSRAFLVGNHGMEGLGRGSPGRSRSTCRNWLKTLRPALNGVGVEIEDKSYSLALHYRRSRNKKKAKARIQEAVARLSPQPRVVPGKSVINLVPAGAPHKGMAILQLMKIVGVKQALYVGDDDTDEDVFGLPTDARVMTIRVGRKRASAARFFIDHQSGINTLLARILEFHDKPPAPGARRGLGSDAFRDSPGRRA